MRHRQLPQDLQERVRRFVQYKWLATRGVDEESILRDLPLDLRREIQRHLCLTLVRRVSFLQFLSVEVWCKRTTVVMLHLALPCYKMMLAYGHMHISFNLVLKVYAHLA